MATVSPDLGLVVLVVGDELRRLALDLAVDARGAPGARRHDHRLVHLVADHRAGQLCLDAHVCYLLRLSRRIVLMRARSRRSVAHLGRRLELPHRLLDPQPEQLVVEVLLARAQLVDCPARGSPPTFMTPSPAPNRVANLVLIGSLAAASCIARRASVSLTPSISNRMRPGTDDAHPFLGRALALAHAGFLRLLRDRLVREHAHPDLAAALDEARHRHARRLDLARRHPARLHRLQAVVAERDVRSAPRLAGHAPALLLAVLDLLRHQHRS